MLESLGGPERLWRQALGGARSSGCVFLEELACQ